MLIDEVGENPTQFLEIDAAGLQHFGRRRVIEHRQQQVFNGDELMLLLPGLDKSHMERDFQFLRNHNCSQPQSQCQRFVDAYAAYTALTAKSPPSCTAMDADAYAQCSILGRLWRQRLPGCRFRTRPYPLGGPVT